MGHEAVSPLFQFCPRCGRPGFASSDGRLHVCGGCGLHFYRNITTAVAGILVDPRDRVLLIRRARDPARGMLAFPGGFIDAGETAEGALRREVREEVGLEAGEPRFLTSAPNIYHYREVSYDVLDLIFVARVPSLDQARALDEVADVRVTPASEVDPGQLAFPSLRAAWRLFSASLG